MSENPEVLSDAGYAAAWFAKAAQDGALEVPFCKSCGKAHWYPREHCPFCSSTDVEARKVSGKGKIYTYSVSRQANPPYAIAYVELAEGPRVMTNIIDSDIDNLHVGDAVELTFKKTDKATLPAFRVV